MRKLIYSVVASFLWLVASNHCFVSVAFALNPSSKSGHHCGEEKHKTSDKQAPGHHSCCDSGCCQPVIKSFDSSAGLSSIGKSLVWNPFFPALYFAYIPFGADKISNQRFPVFNHSPPGNLDLLTLSLSSASNAPPIL